MEVSMKTFTQMMKFSSFKERFDYLKLSSIVADPTFGHDRYINQLLYKSKEWLQLRSKIIVRDNSADLGCEERPVSYKVTIHHIDPITIEDIKRSHPKVFDPENLVCCSFDTHNAIHLGNYNLTVQLPQERKAGDHILWTPFSQASKDF